MRVAYHCVHCDATFDHPDTEDCESRDGHCARLIVAGWKPVWIRVLFDFNGQRERHVFSRGGWMCPACAKRFKLSAKPRRRRRVAA